MSKDVPNDITAAINTIFSKSHNIRRPEICGAQSNVYFTDWYGDTYVFKFSPYELAQKNKRVSQIFRTAEIPVPEIYTGAGNGLECEFYKMIPGKTLYEQIWYGMSSAKIQTAYRDMVDCFAKMNKLSAHAHYQLAFEKYKYIHQVVRTNVSKTNNKFWGKFASGLVRLANIGPAKDNGLYHTGLIPENVIVSNDGRMRAILDIDEAALCDKNYAFALMVAKYQQLGYDTRELMDYYEQLSGDHLNRRHVQTMINMTNAAKHMLCKHANKRGSR